MDSFEKEFARIKAEIPHSKITRIFGALKKDMKGRPFVIYGAGHLAGVVLDFCKEWGIAVTRVCDKNVTGNCGGDGGIPIISPQKLKEDYADAAVFIASHTFRNEIYDDLKKLGFDSEQIILYPFESSRIESVASFNKYLDGYAWAYDFFRDGRSKRLVLDKIRLYLLDEMLKPNTQSELYYEEGFISLGENEIFVDGGAYTGDSVKTFINKMNFAGKDGGARYAHIYAFDPDPYNYKEAVHNLSRYHSVDVIPKGLWSVETELVFFHDDSMPTSSSSETIPNGGKTLMLPVTSLDTFFDGKQMSELPTFVKMDIEGAEKGALLGAVNVIRRAKPKLAICAYHKMEDFYELTRAILSIRDDYRFALRQHCHGFRDTVLYAV